MKSRPSIPEFITVHLGRPNSNARNITVSFPDYIKNVASSEIYPTWPERALRANINCQVSLALNRIYTEWYRSQGYDFDITNSTQYDQAFFEGRDFFENISNLVDELFNDYAKRLTTVEPFFAEYCNGTTATCRGLSQWGTVTLANQGYVPIQILTYYYGNNIEMIYNAPVLANIPSYPGTPLAQGSTGSYVMQLQIQINRISINYPALPRVATDGIFGVMTENAVQKFQSIFNLTVDGIVGTATWYKMSYIYVSVKRLAQLTSEGEKLIGADFQYPYVLVEGDVGNSVKAFQYFLATIGTYNVYVPPIPVDGIFGPLTKSAVIAFQNLRGFPPTGVVNKTTWDSMYAAYLGIVETIPPGNTVGTEPYPGIILRKGMQGPSVLTMQNYLNSIAEIFTDIPTVNPTGYFGDNTEASVIAFQQRFLVPPADGLVGPITWNNITSVYATLRSGRQSTQFPGYTMNQGMND